jgi:hypothetical protein
MLIVDSTHHLCVGFAGKQRIWTSCGYARSGGWLEGDVTQATCHLAHATCHLAQATCHLAQATCSISPQTAVARPCLL